MVDYSVFDSILDSAFVIDGSGQVVYANDAAASFCALSIRRMVSKSNVNDLFSLNIKGLFPFCENSPGRIHPTPFTEADFVIKRTERKGRAQLAVRPLGADRWVLFVRDVSLEESLHSKYRSELKQKEEYAKNLEKIVEARTQELSSVNQTLNAILNSLGQGFFTFNRSGQCGPVFTHACKEILGHFPSHMNVMDVLSLNEKDRLQFVSWVRSLFDEVLPFEELAPLGPTHKTLGENRQVELEYHPIRNTDSSILDVVVVATDKTSEIEAQRALEVERQHATMIVRYVKNKFQFLQFLSSVRQNLERLEQISCQPMPAEVVHEAFRILHTLEGEAGVFSIRSLRDSSRNAQECLAVARDEGSGLDDEGLRLFAREMIQLRASFAGFLADNRDVFRLPEGEISQLMEVSLVAIESFLNTLKARVVDPSLIDQFENLFLRIELADSLEYYDALAQGIAEKLGKQLKPLVFECSGIRLRSEPYKKLLASLVHAFRNAVDHGIEMPDERVWMGKSAAGEIRVNAKIEGGKLRLSVSDDGRGIDPSAIRSKVIEQMGDGTISAMSDEEVIQCIFQPGFSTRNEVGDYSGRGVGLDALREEVMSLNGELKVYTNPGMGTRIEILVPILESANVLLRSA